MQEKKDAQKAKVKDISEQMKEKVADNEERKKTEKLLKKQASNKKLEEAKEGGVEGIFKYVIGMVFEYVGKLKGGLITYIVAPLIFASVAPTLPLFLFMAGLFAILRFLMGILKKL